MNAADEWLSDPGLTPWLAAEPQPVSEPSRHLSSVPAAVARVGEPRAASCPPAPPPVVPLDHDPTVVAPPRSAPPPVAAPAGTAFTILDPRPLARPSSGWRRLVYRSTAGRLNPGLSAAEAVRHRLISRVRTPLPGTHRVVTASLKGGIGKTTVTAVLGLTLAEYRGDRVIAVDANPDAGTLADRLTGHVGMTVRDLLDNLHTIHSLTDLAHYTSLAGRLQVLASEQDPAMSEAFSRDEYEAVMTVLARHHNVLLTDSGTGLVHSAMGGALAHADTLVIVGAPTLDGASRASKTLDWLVAHGYGHLVERAVVALCHDRSSRAIDYQMIHDHFASRCSAVVDIPPDPHLMVGGLITLGEMRTGTRDAFLTLAAHIGDQFNRRCEG